MLGGQRRRRRSCSPSWRKTKVRSCSPALCHWNRYWLLTAAEHLLLERERKKREKNKQKKQRQKERKKQDAAAAKADAVEADPVAEDEDDSSGTEEQDLAETLGRERETARSSVESEHRLAQVRRRLMSLSWLARRELRCQSRWRHL